MIDPYRMVLVNLISLILLLFGILAFKFLHPKRPINLFVLLILISLLPIISILRQGAYESGDFNIHIYRIIAFFDSLKEGILIPSWAAQLNATYGNPLFLFNYSLPYYAISFFHFIGIDFINSTKLYLGMVFYFSGITIYITVKEITNNNLESVIGFRQAWFIEWDWIRQFPISHPKTGPYIYVGLNRFPKKNYFKEVTYNGGYLLVPNDSTLEKILVDK